MPSVRSEIVPITWNDKTGEIVWLNNREIPAKEEYVSSKSLDRLAVAIKSLEIRGAPILGEAGAYGIALAANLSSNSTEDILKNVRNAGDMLFKTRPTAVNLGWGIRKLTKIVEDATKEGKKADEIKALVITEAKKVQEENILATQKMGEYGKSLINDGDVLMTVCNAGTLACDGIGTATAPLRAAWAEGKRFRVLVTYTAPLYQGARLTAWELHRDGIPIQVITDNATGHLIREEKVTAAWAGADRIIGSGADAGNVYNKIGTYNLGVLLKHHGGKLYVAAPTSTIDPVTQVSGVKIEERSEEEVGTIMGRVKIIPEGVKTRNPAFDRTPPELVSAIVTELGVAKAPYTKSLPELLAKEESMA